MHAPEEAGQPILMVDMRSYDHESGKTAGPLTLSICSCSTS